MFLFRCRVEAVRVSFFHVSHYNIYAVALLWMLKLRYQAVLKDGVSDPFFLMTNIWLYLILGLMAGIASGLVGIGGGIIIVPVLVFIFGLTQHQAQGTTLAMMVPPVGILAAWTYYQKGYVDIKIALLMCLGFTLGSLLGAKLAVNIPNNILEKIFGAALLAISIKMLIGRSS
jgi:uncharacterized membrane protein YfcA